MCSFVGDNFMLLVERLKFHPDCTSVSFLSKFHNHRLELMTMIAFYIIAPMPNFEICLYCGTLVDSTYEKISGSDVMRQIICAEWMFREASGYYVNITHDKLKVVLESLKYMTMSHVRNSDLCF